MIKFIRDVLSENGSPSSKRVAFFILLFAFLLELAVNLIWNKLLSDTLRDQLYYAMLSCLAVIFGVNITQMVKDIKVTQSQNNAASGLPSPTPDTTVITPK